MTIQDKDIGWLAGIIDGEGNLTIRILFHETKTLGRRARFSPQLVICNTDKKVIEKSKRILDNLKIQNTVYEQKRSLKNPKNKNMWTITTYATGLTELIPHIENHCIKKPEIELVKKVLQISFEKRKNKKPYTNEELIKMDKLKTELVSLHGNQAKKLSKNMASECLTTEKQLSTYTTWKKENAKRMTTFRKGNNT